MISLWGCQETKYVGRVMEEVRTPMMHICVIGW